MGRAPGRATAAILAFSASRRRRLVEIMMAHPRAAPVCCSAAGHKFKKITRSQQVLLIKDSLRATGSLLVHRPFLAT